MKRKFNRAEAYGAIDGGGNKLFVRYGANENDVAPMTRMEFLSCNWVTERRFSGIKQFAGEYAHLAVPQTEKSLSQIYSASQLMGLYDRLDDLGVSLFYLPEKQMSKIAWDIDPSYASKNKKTDEKDTLVWYKWLASGHTDNLQPAIRDANDHAERGRDHQSLIEIVNSTLNTMRHGKYDERAMYTEGEFFPDNVDYCVKFMRDWCSCYDSSSKSSAPERRKCVNELYRTIGCKHDCSGKGEFDVLLNRSKFPMSTAVASLINPRTGETIRKSNGRFRSVDEIMKVVGSSPNHGRMGVARSNLYLHTAMNLTKSRCKDAGEPIKENAGYDGPFRQSVLTEGQLAIHKQVRRDVKRATRDCVRYVQKCLQGSRESDRLF